MMIKSFVFTVLIAAVLAGDLRRAPSNNNELELIQEQCRKNGVETNIENSIMNYATCSVEVIDYGAALIEVQQSKSNNFVLRDVVKNQCTKVPRLKGCMFTLLDSIYPCMDKPLKEHIKKVKNVYEALFSFACSNDGEKITTFIDEDGPECIESKIDDIAKCSSDFKFNGLSLTPTEFCTRYNQFHDCAYPKLDSCNASAAARMLTTFTEIIRSNYPCPTNSFNDDNRI